MSSVIACVTGWKSEYVIACSDVFVYWTYLANFALTRTLRSLRYHDHNYVELSMFMLLIIEVFINLRAYQTPFKSSAIKYYTSYRRLLRQTQVIITPSNHGWRIKLPLRLSFDDCDGQERMTYSKWQKNVLPGELLMAFLLEFFARLSIARNCHEQVIFTDVKWFCEKSISIFSYLIVIVDCEHVAII